MVAPTTIASQFIGPAWKGAVILSFVWFLHRWKTNVITRALAMKSVEGLDRDKLLTLDKLSSVGLFVLGGMTLAEACGVAVQSILTVGGIGGNFCCDFMYIFFSEVNEVYYTTNKLLKSWLFVMYKLEVLKSEMNKLSHKQKRLIV